MRKLLAVLLCGAILFSLVGCKNAVSVEIPAEVVEELAQKVEKIVEENQAAKAYADSVLANAQKVSNAPSEFYKRSDFKKIADNLYEVEYEDYDIDYMLKGPSVVELEKILHSIFSAGCTAVRKDNFYGRNLDFIYGDLAEVVVKVKANEERYGSVAITGGFSFMTPYLIDNKALDIVSQACLPVMICDGINEKGVVCNVNVVPAADLETFTKGTNPGKHDLNMYAIPRFVLDKAGSAKEAIELLENENIFTPWDAADLNPKGMEFHFMIADNDNTYVVEFINNKMEVVDLTNEKDKIMTNFYLYYKDEKTPHSSGVERYKIIQDQYDDIKSIDDMKKAMESVKFSKCYGDENGDNVWYSDTMMAAKDGTIVGFDNYEPYVEEIKEKAKEKRAELLKSVEGKYNDGGYWITMHTSVFDIENKTLEIAVQERYNEGYYKYTVE